MSIQLQDGLAGQSVDHVLEDLLARFLVNSPEEDLSSIERIFFQVEEAQWFYLDFVRHINPLLPSMKLKSFAPAILSKCPLIWRWGDPRDALSKFGKYKSTIPVRGIALMNEDLTKVLLVQGMESGSWSFPRGKISKDESDLECAIREVREETGFDARQYVNDKDVVERTIYGKNMKIFLARGVPEDTAFAPLSRHEISSIKWFDLRSLPKALKANPQKFFAVDPLIKSMIKWANAHKGYVDEEELKREAEAKLKALMGIGANKDNNDAGRELLNILQARPQADSRAQPAGAQPMFSMIPPQLQNPAFLQQHNAFAPPGYLPQNPAFPQAFAPMMPPAHLLPPQQSPSIPHGPSTNNSKSQDTQAALASTQTSEPELHETPQTKLNRVKEHNAQEKEFPKPPSHLSQYSTPLEPSAQSLSLPRRIGTASNSKEFLSLLKAPKASQNTSEQKPTGNLLHRPVATNAPPSYNEPVERLPSSERIALAATPFLSVTHREDILDSSGHSSAGSTTPKKVTLLKREKDADASKTLLGLLGKNPGSSASQPSSQIKQTEHEASNAPSAFLYQQYRDEQPAYSSIEKQVSSPQPVSSSASADLLGILKRETLPPSKKQEPWEEKGKPIRIAKKSDSASIDLKKILSGGSDRSKTSSQIPESPAQKNSGSGNAILEMLNKKSVTPDAVRLTPQPQVAPENFENFEDFEDFDNLGDIGSPLDIHAGIEDDIYDEYEENAANSFAESRQPHATQDYGTQASAFSKPESYLDIYGSGDQTIKLQPHQPSNLDNGASLLALLGKKPTRSGVANQQQSSNGRNDLLNLLKGGANR